MNIVKLILLALSVVAVAFAAPVTKSTAALVAKAQNKGYSAPTRDKFLKSCKEGVEAPICECVLKKLEGKYDEATFSKFENDLAKGKEDASYVNFIVLSTTECGEVWDASSANQGQESVPNGMGLSSEDMLIFKAIVQSSLFKDSFIQSCTVQSMEWLGANQADKSCNCAFDRLTKDDKFIEKMDNINFEKWGFDFIEPCLPQNYPAETDNAFLKECMGEGADKATCDCVLKSIKKDYTVRSLMKAAFEDQKNLEMDIMLKSAKCLSK
jgi:hypothetical protein